jgi:hypothetical protein
MPGGHALLDVILVCTRGGLEYMVSRLPHHITPDDIDVLLRLRRDWNQWHEGRHIGALPVRYVAALASIKETFPGSEVVYG